MKTENTSFIRVRSKFLLSSVETEWAILKQGLFQFQKRSFFFPVGELAEPIQLLPLSLLEEQKGAVQRQHQNTESSHRVGLNPSCNCSVR